MFIWYPFSDSSDATARNALVANYDSEDSWSGLSNTSQNLGHNKDINMSPCKEDFNMNLLTTPDQNISETIDTYESPQS